MTSTKRAASPVEVDAKRVQATAALPPLVNPFLPRFDIKRDGAEPSPNDTPATWRARVETLPEALQDRLWGGVFSFTQRQEPTKPGMMDASFAVVMASVAALRMLPDRCKHGKNETCAAWRARLAGDSAAEDLLWDGMFRTTVNEMKTTPAIFPEWA